MSLADVHGHLAAAQRTHRTLRVLADATRPLEPAHTARDWMLTMHFYVLVGLVNALAEARGRRFLDHSQRRTWMQTQTDLRDVSAHYRMLEDWSRDCRYEGWVPDRLDDAHSAFVAVRDRLVALLRAAGVTDVPVLDPVDVEQH